jgi:hypothetical protein
MNDLPFRYVRFPRHVLRDVNTLRGFDASGFGYIFHQWWNTTDRVYLKVGFPALGAEQSWLIRFNSAQWQS